MVPTHKQIAGVPTAADAWQPQAGTANGNKPDHGNANGTLVRPLCQEMSMDCEIFKVLGMAQDCIEDPAMTSARAKTAAKVHGDYAGLRSPERF